MEFLGYKQWSLFSIYVILFSSLIAVVWCNCFLVIFNYLSSNTWSTSWKNTIILFRRKHSIWRKLHIWVPKFYVPKLSLIQLTWAKWCPWSNTCHAVRSPDRFNRHLRLRAILQTASVLVFTHSIFKDLDKMVQILNIPKAFGIQSSETTTIG